MILFYFFKGVGEREKTPRERVFESTGIDY